MENQHSIKLARAVYRVTNLFPENEPLKRKIRETADEILANFATLQKSSDFDLGNERDVSRGNQCRNHIFRKIDILTDYYFNLAREQQWVNPVNFSVLEREYNKMKADVEILASGNQNQGIDENQDKNQESESDADADQESDESVSGKAGQIQDIKEEFVSPERPEVEESDIPEIMEYGYKEEQDNEKDYQEDKESKGDDKENAQNLEAQEQPEIEITAKDENHNLSVIVDRAKRELKADEHFKDQETENKKDLSKETAVSEDNDKELSQRQREILEIIRKGGSKQVGEIGKSFPGLSKRTLRRDLEFLLKKGYVERLGQWNEVSYQIKMS